MFSSKDLNCGRQRGKQDALPLRHEDWKFHSQI